MWSALFVWNASDLFKLTLAASSGWFLARFAVDLIAASFDFSIKTILYKMATRKARKGAN